MFDFSDDTGKEHGLIGFQHQNENLNRDTFLGNLISNNWWNDNSSIMQRIFIQEYRHNTRLVL